MDPGKFGMAFPLVGANQATATDARHVSPCAVRLASNDFVRGAEAVKKAGDLHGFSKWEKALHSRRCNLTESRSVFSQNTSGGNYVDRKANDNNDATAITRADQNARAETLTDNGAGTHEKS